jgi:DNA polymerase-3 subunit alpha
MGSSLEEANIEWEQVPFMSNHNHTEISNFRLKDCIIRIEDLINRAAELGFHGVSITDHEALSGHVRFLERYQTLKAAKTKYDSYIANGDTDGLAQDADVQKELKYVQVMPADFKIGLGNEIYLVDDIADVTTNYQPGVTKFWHFILIAKDAIGYQQLRRISSESAWKHWFKHGRMERVPTIKRELEEIIGNDKGHLIAQTACLGGEFATNVLKYYRDNDMAAKRKIHRFVKWCIRIFGPENFFFEMQPTLEVPVEGDNDYTASYDQIIVNAHIPFLANAYGLRYVVTTDSHYLKKEDRAIHESYLNSDEDNNSNREVGEFYATTFMASQSEMADMLLTHLTPEEVETAMRNTMLVHSMIEDFDLHHDVVVPSRKNLPPFKIRHRFADYYHVCPYIEKFAKSPEEQDRFLLSMIEDGFDHFHQAENTTCYKVRVGADGKSEEYVAKIWDMESKMQRINTELRTLWLVSDNIHMRLSSYYVLVQDIVENVMWPVSYVGVARGSVTGFYICYLLKISQMNPLKYDLPEWRHLHESRPELPDIDLDSEASKRPLIFQRTKDHYGHENVLNCLTLKTEGSKSTVLTACRGLGIDNDAAQTIADLVPFERGKNWTLTECFEGNEENGRAPVTEFCKEVAQYSRLKETMMMIEGLICGRSIHASALYVFEDGYIKQNSCMRAPNGTEITCFNMEDSDKCGALKVDFLTIQALDKIHLTMNFLEENHIIEPGRTIRETYDKYIHPDKLDYQTPAMWDLVGNVELIDCFQFETMQGSQAARKVRPHSIQELADANTLMRLMADGEEQPIDEYVKYRGDIGLWYQEMRMFGLNEEEIKIMRKHLDSAYGVASAQEHIMLLAMDEKIAGFSVKDANVLRKAIAKKKAKLIEQSHNLFFQKGESLGTRPILLHYVWDVQIKRQLGYSFSLNHTMPYSCIALQEMNLAYHYGKLYWNTACLTVNAGADETNDNNKSTQYGKIAKAIGNIKKQGQKVALPDIQRAKFSFVPDTQRDEIVFGLKGICGVGDALATRIVEGQPYQSFADFLGKMHYIGLDGKEGDIGETAVITLIKAGAFDALEPNLSRSDLMWQYIRQISNPLDKLTFKDIETLAAIPGVLHKEEQAYEVRLTRFRKYLFDDKFCVKQTGKGDSTKWYRMPTQAAESFYYKYFAADAKEDKDFCYDDNGSLVVKRSSIDRVYKKLMQPFKEHVLDNPYYLNIVNTARAEEAWNTRLSGNLSKWEMDSVSYYDGPHELAQIDRAKYGVAVFSELPENPVVTDYIRYRNIERPRFALCALAGTILDKDKYKHTITLLTPEDVVTVKFYKGNFVYYDKRISEVDKQSDTKTVLEKSWFTRGNKLLITGYRRGDQFVPRKYNDSVFQHTVQLITDIKEDGTLILRSDRIGGKYE